jgi:hypothetical protein
MMRIRSLFSGLVDRFYDLFLDPGQDATLARYKARRVITSPKEEEALHMFFSPTRIPPGLTNEEARLCMSLYERRKLQKARDSERRGGMHFISFPTPLPQELMPGGRMSRDRFAAGIRKFLEASAEAA